MLDSVFIKIFGDPNEKKLSQYKNVLAQSKKFEEEFLQTIKTVEDVQAKTQELKSKFEGLNPLDEKDAKTVEKLLEEVQPQAFAVHKIACRIINGQSFELSP